MTIVKTVLLGLLITLLCGAVFAQGLLPEHFYDEPDEGYLSNVVIDIVDHNGYIYLASGEGINVSYDNGVTWHVLDKSTAGLPSSSISAIFSVPYAFGNRLWVASNHVEDATDFLYNYSDGVSYSDDDGDSWTQIDFGETGLDIDYVWGGDRTIFDITGHYDSANTDFDDWMFFTAFAGGFLASRDGGESWRRIYGSSSDSVQFNTANVVPSLRNRYFSCAVDTSHGDTLQVWAGAAGGLFAYNFVEPKDKVYPKYVNDIQLCSGCSGDSSFVFFAGGEGFARGFFGSGPYISRFTEQGLPGNEVTAVYAFGGRVFAGCYADSITSFGLGISDDNGTTFSDHLLMISDTVSDFTAISNRLFMAAGASGLYMSSDTGTTWEHTYLDSTNTVSNINNVRSLEAWGDTLLVGTDTGLTLLFLDPSGNKDSLRTFAFDNPASQGPRVVKIKLQDYNGTPVIWTLNRLGNGDTGIEMIGRSSDRGSTFTTLLPNVITYDLDFIADTTYAVTEGGMYLTPDSADFGNPANERIVYVEEYVDGILIDSLGNDTMTALEIIGDTIYVGTNNGFAYSLDRGETFDIVRINQDSLHPDLVLFYSSAITGIESDWVPALGVQYTDTQPFAWTWISTRPTYSGSAAISLGVPLEQFVVDTITNDTTFLGYTKYWGQVYDNFAWNFAFASDTVFAATDDGLLMAVTDSLAYGSTGYDWTVVDLEDSSGQSLVLPGTPVYGVEVADSLIWVGTDDRTVVINRSDLSDQSSLFVLDRNTPADEVYAFPVPYSHVNSQAVEFHFSLAEEADVTIEIYDFAMNLVRRVIDQQTYPAGTYPERGSYRPTWDGTNGQGDEVAVGVYYFKVELSSGDVRWGKLAVIP